MCMHLFLCLEIPWGFLRSRRSLLRDFFVWGAAAAAAAAKPPSAAGAAAAAGADAAISPVCFASCGALMRCSRRGGDS